MLHGTMTKPVGITYVKKHHSCFETKKDCLFIDYIITCDIMKLMESNPHFNTPRDSCVMERLMNFG